MDSQKILHQISDQFGLHPQWMKQHLPKAGLKAYSVDDVVKCLKINETYFWRFSEQFEWLRDHFLPAFISSGNNSLNILSAGCSTGEEAYAAGAVCKDYLDHHAPHISLSVTGIDISRSALKKADNACYTGWSLREMPEHLINQWLVHNGDTYCVKEDYRKHVRFLWGNLFQNEYEKGFEQPFDLILCRNVLIYIKMSNLSVFHSHLFDLLETDGYLLLGPVDPRPSPELPFKIKWHHNFPVYKRHTAEQEKTNIPEEPDEIEPIQCDKYDDKKISSILDLMEQKSYREAWLQIKDFSGIHPDNPYLLFLSGICLFALKQKEKAFAIMLRARDLLSNLPPMEKPRLSDTLTAAQLNYAIQTYLDTSDTNP